MLQLCSRHDYQHTSPIWWDLTASPNSVQRIEIGVTITNSRSALIVPLVWQLIQICAAQFSTATEWLNDPVIQHLHIIPQSPSPSYVHELPCSPQNRIYMIRTDINEAWRKIDESTPSPHSHAETFKRQLPSAKQPRPTATAADPESKRTAYQFAGAQKNK